MISVLILTVNEEANLTRCLDSLTWSDDIVVLDSGSVDHTADIANQYGARVVTRAFDNERSQRTYSLREISFKHPWLYNPDADEVTTEELRDEMLSVIADKKKKEVAYRVRFKVMFMDQWIKRSSLYPTWVMRLFRPDRIRLERSVNLRYSADGLVGFLRSHFLHYSFNKGIDAWYQKHREYARSEAQEALKVIGKRHADWVGLFSRSDPLRQRQAIKDLSFRLPVRPLLRFMYTYVWRMGFMDGRSGLRYCLLMANYERMIDEELRRLRHVNESSA